MPRQLSDELHASLRDRTRAFRTHIQAIRTDNLGAPEAFHEALQLVDLYTRMLEQHIERKCRDDQTEVDRVRSLKQVLSGLTSKEEDVDKLFARGGQSSIPRSLSRRIQDEFHALDLRDAPRPVLTIGPPGNFEVQIMDFRAHLFADLWHADYQAEAEYRLGNFALISVPYLEGTRAFWEPLVLGHEVGHFQVHYRNNRSGDEPVGSGDHYLDSILNGLELQSDRKSRSWLQEFLCDLNAYRLYGPAAISAVGEMLAVAGGPGNEASDVHPPRSTRLLLLKRVAELRGDTNTNLFSHITSSWIELAEEKLVFSVPPQPLEYLSVFLDNVDLLWNAVEAWGVTYDYSHREQRIVWLSEERLQRGIPCGLSSEWLGNGAEDEFVPADLINAAWAAESNKEDDDLPIDSLTLKGLDNLEFASLWSRSMARMESTNLPERVENYYPEDPDVALLEDLERRLDLSDSSVLALFETVKTLFRRSGSGVMSQSDLLRRMSPQYSKDQRLVSTPLLDGALREASLDIRLSSSFIVFKHSATEVFDAISGGQDPREMQESVEKEWGSRFILHPNELVLASTLEYLVFPGDIVGEVASRSSYGRLGLLSVTASKIQPWSIGCITLELVNTSQTPIALTVGERIAQIIFQRLPRPVPRLRQTYRWPIGPEFSRVRDDWDRPILRGVGDILAGRPATVDPDRAHRMAESGATLLDVRLTHEWERGHIDGSQSIPIGRLAEEMVGIDRNSPVVVVSRTGHRAERAAGFLLRWGYDVYHMTGGLLAWRARQLALCDVRGDPGTVI